MAVINGSNKSETLNGTAGDDTLNGLEGADILIGKAGADELNGGDGIDTASYASSTVGVAVDLDDKSGLFGEAEGDTYDSIENVVGSSKNDEILGDDKANKLEGGAGNDTLDGASGADTLDGGAGDDLLIGGIAADILVGGANTTGIGDTASYTGSAGGVTIDLTQQATAYNSKTGVLTGGTAQTGGQAAGDILFQIENVHGSASADKITGDAKDNIIEGASDADEMHGGLGIDTLSYAGDVADLTVSLGANGGIVVASGGHAAGDTGDGFENIRGGFGNDKLTGNTAKNRLEGGDGNDTLIGGGDVDTLDGGLLSDTVDYSALTITQSFTIALAESGIGKTATVTSTVASDAKGDILKDIENITGGAGNDKITGNNSNNTLIGGAGDDIIEGGTGDADKLDGGAGTNDTVSYANYAGTGVSANLSQQGTGGAFGVAGAAQEDLNGGDADYLWGFENITGSKQGDILIGDAGVNTILGGAGADIIEGGAGADILNGGAANEGNTLSYAGDTTGVVVELVSGKQATILATGSDADGDIATNFMNLIGGSNDDNLLGDKNANVIEGGAGADFLVGAGGSDTVSYAGGSTAVTVDLTKQGSVDKAGLPDGVTTSTLQTGGDAAGDELYSFENILGGGGDDKLTGDGGANKLDGGKGADTLFGGLGVDTLFGGDDNDTLVGGAGGDTLNGGAGFDTVDYSALAGNFTIALGKAGVAGNVAASIKTSDAAGDKLIDVEQIKTGAGNDVLTASNFGVAFYGGFGNDTLTGGTADDKLVGADGDDRFYISTGTDEIVGGGDNETNGDTVDASKLTSGVTIDLTAGVVTNKAGVSSTITGIEHVVGSAKDDVIAADTIIANLLDGGAGIDTINYGGGSGAVTVDLSKQYTVSKGVFGGAGEVVGGSGGTGDKIANFENITGGSKADTLTGDAKDNVIEGREDADILDGGKNTAVGDTLSYAASNALVNVTLSDLDNTNATVSGGHAGGDQAKNFENILGSEYNDVLTGNSKANTLRGGEGDDTLAGRGGADQLVGDLGTDTADYSASVDAVTINLGKQGAFNAATGKITGATAQVGGEAAGDLLSGIENVKGTAKNDVFYASAAANAFDGGSGGIDTVSYVNSTVGISINLDTSIHTGDAAGDIYTSIDVIVGTGKNDHLTGDGGNNTFDGGAGDDTLSGGAGADQLVGGANTAIGDTADYASSGTAVTVNLSQQGTAFTNGVIVGGTAQAGGEATLDILFGIENVSGSIYNDILTGDKNANTISGGAGDDLLVGGAGADKIDGGTDIDTVSYAGQTMGVTVTLGSGGNYGAAGKGGDGAGDLIKNVENVIGGSGADKITGSTGDNEITGGLGNDIMDGGGGRDTFIRNNGDGADTINNFKAGLSAEADVLDFTTVTGADNFVTAMSKAAQVGNDTVFTFDAGQTVTLKGVLKDDLVASNFEFGGAAPTDINLDNLTVSEALAIGDKVGTLTGTDETDPSEELTYVLIDDAGGLFELSGNIVKLKAGLNYESATSHEITIRVIDSTSAYYDETFTINVTDANDAPTKISLDNAKISEAAEVGDVVGNLLTVDEDEPGDMFTYTLIDDAGGLFSLVGSQIKVNAPLDADTASKVQLQVEVNDGNGGVFQQFVQINVLQAVEGFAPDGYVKNADVFYDTDGDLQLDVGEMDFATQTDDVGYFALALGGEGDIVVSGGTDISTGNPFSGFMKAPNGSTVVTPLTTLISYLIALGENETSANAIANNLAGNQADVNLLHFDPIAATLSSVPATAALGVVHAKAAIALQNASAQMIALTNGGGQSVWGELADYFQGGGTLAGLSNAATVEDILENISNFSPIDPAVIPGAAQIIASINAQFLAATGSGTALLTLLAQIAGVAHEAAVDLDTANSGNINGLVTLYTGSSLDDEIDDEAGDVGNVEGANAGDTINGTPNIDVLEGFGGNDIINADAGNDLLDGGDGNDELNAGLGRDILIGGLGDDKFDGGIWNDNIHPDGYGDLDYVSYANSATKVTVNLQTGTATGEGSDTITHVEGIIGSAFDDTLIGGANEYVENFRGGAGNDIINGRGTLAVGKGGGDRAIYNDATGGITVNLSAGTVSGAGIGKDTLIGVEEVYGSSFNDVFDATGFGSSTGANKGDRGTFNVFRGGDGDDKITGNEFTWIDYTDATQGISIDLSLGKFEGGAGLGTDTWTGISGVRGTSFNDVLIGGQERYGQPNVSESYTGWGGDDLIIGGSGFDTAFYNYALNAMTIGITVDMANGIVTGDAVQVGTDTLRGVEGVRGTSLADTYYAVGHGINSLNARAFNIGVDEFEGGAGNDEITGSGITRVSYINSTSGVTVNLSGGLAAMTTVTGDASVGTDTLNGGIMHIRGTRFNDVLTGFTNAAGTGQLFEAADGDDVINGGGGFDIAFYLWDTTITAGITVNMKAGTIVGDLSVGSDTLTGVEAVRATNFADVYDATGFATNVGTNKGNAGGVDVGGIGTSGTIAFNAFEGGGGNDTIIGNGNTRIEFNGSTGGVTANLATGKSEGAAGNNSVGVDTITLGSVNAIVGSSYDDTLIGDNANNNLSGANGKDFLTGNGGNDILNGGQWMDGTNAIGMNDLDFAVYSNATAGITVIMNAGTNANGVFGTVTGNASVGTDTIQFVEGIIGSSHADTMTGGANGYREVFRGGGGNDIINGGAGFDVSQYIDATGGVAVTIGAGGNGFGEGTGANQSGIGKDTLSGIEYVIGSNFNDNINFQLFDALGFNGVRGGGGNDNIVGNGSTRLDYFDAVNVGVTVDLTKGTVNATASGLGTDTFSGVNSVRGSNFADILIGGQTAYNVGGIGNFESFVGQGGNDYIDGGLGFDRAQYDTAEGEVQDRGITVKLAAGIVTGDPDLVGTDTLRGIEAILGTQLDDIYDASGFGPNSKNSGSFGTFNEFEGGAGNDYIIGNGNTRIAFNTATSSSADGVYVDLSVAQNFAGALPGNGSVGVDSQEFVGQVNSVRGSRYNDDIYGNDIANAPSGFFDNVLDGSFGDDYINGRGGNDKLTGGNGATDLGNDTFAFYGNFGHDVITDFQGGAGLGGGVGDIIELDMSLFADFTAVQNAWADDGNGNVVITYDANNTITILGKTISQLDQDDFTFLM
jgi:Ca2+-binding RTX toxin-like protein